MTETTSTTVPIVMGDRGEEELPDYRPICGLAIIGLLAGVVSLAAFLHPVLWCLAIVGTLLNGLALRQIVAGGTPLSGRRLALIGLTLSCLFGASAVARYTVRSIIFRSQARAVADAWIVLLREGEIHRAHQMTGPPANRFPLDDQLPEKYAEMPMMKKPFELFYTTPLIRLLLFLGPRAEVRYFGTDNVKFGKSEAVATEIYTLTIDDGGQRTSCFIQFDVTRVYEKKRWMWKLSTPLLLNDFPRGWPGRS